MINDDDTKVGAAACLAVLVVLVLSLTLSALMVLFAWNVGVDAITDVKDITFVQALGISFVLSIIANVFRTAFVRS